MLHRLLLLLCLLLPASVLALSLTLAWDPGQPLVPTDGYVLTRNGVEVGRTTATRLTDPLPGPGSYTYTVQAVVGGDRSAPSAPLTLSEAALPCTVVQTPTQLTLTCATVPQPPVVPPGPYPLRPVGTVSAQADSEDTGYEARLAVDGLPPTFWTTQWRTASPPLPHTLTLDLGAVVWVDGLAYTPRQDGNLNGTLVQYRSETTLDGTTWTVASTGTWPADASAKATRFAAVQARSVRLVGLASAGGGPWASAAEVGVYAVEGGTP